MSLGSLGQGSEIDSEHVSEDQDGIEKAIAKAGVEKQAPKEEEGNEEVKEEKSFG
jgi:hypothetical protein